MIALESVPMFKVFCFVFLGILLGYYLQLTPSAYIVCSVLFLLIAFFGLFKKGLPIKWITISSISLLLCLSAISAYNYSYQKFETPIEDGYYNYVAVLNKVIHQNEDYTRAYLKILSTKDKELRQPYTIISNIYSDRLQPGDTIVAQSYIKQLSAPLNAGQFDVKKYYGYKWVYQTTSLSSSNFIHLPVQQNFHLQRMFYLAAKWSSDVFKKYIPQRSAETMRALLLGKKKDISNDMMQTYMHTGVMHVLAVSGLHVGILYLGFLFLLQPLYKRWGFISILPITLVWLFAFVTGGGPAVLRAALMITLIDVGKKFNEESNSVNLLFTSGWLLLTFQPYLVWDIGFQLSFSAMLGLFFMMKPLQNLVHVKNKWVRNYIVSPSAMSVSAQVATTPLVLFYFGNFPLLFLITNLVILLPVTIALFLGVFLLSASAFLPDVINLGIGHVLDIVLHYGFNAFLSWIVTLPGAYTHQVYLSTWQVGTLALAVLSFVYWVYHIKNGKGLLLSMFFLLITISGTSFRHWNLQQKCSVSILQVPRQHIIAVDNYLWTAGEKDFNVENYGFHLSGYLREIGLKTWTRVPPDFVYKDSSTLVVGDKVFHILNTDMRTFSSQKAVEVDYLILGNDLYLDVPTLNDKFQFKYLVLDGSLDYKKYQLFKNLLNKAEIPFIDTRENGAWKILL